QPTFNGKDDDDDDDDDNDGNDDDDDKDDVDNAKEENEEKLDDAEELYKDVNVNLKKEDVEMTDADQGGADQHNVFQESWFEQEEGDAHVTLTAVHDTQKTKGPMQSSSVSSNFTEKLLNFENVSLADNEIASLMDTTVRHEEPSGQTSSLYTVPVTVIPKIMSAFTPTIPPPPPSFNPLLQQATPTLTPTTSKVTTSFPALPDFASIFRFNNRVTNLERECREEALADMREYIDLIDTSVRAIIKEESTYEAVASLSEFELTEILMDKMDEHKSYLRADYKRELYDALVKYYNTDKDLFYTYGEVFTLKRSQDDKDKDQDPSTRSDRGTKRRKSSKDVESSRDPKSKESKSTSSSKGTSRSQHKSSGKSAHAEEPSHTVDDSGVQQNQEFDTGNNDEQPDDEPASKVDWFKKPEQPPTPDPDWNKRQHVDFRPPQTWITNIARAENPPTSLDELMDTPIDFFMLTNIQPTQRTTYTAYSDPQGVIYKDQNNRNVLMRTDELHKFSDGTLNYVQTALHDITSGIRKEYLLKRNWSGLDKRRACFMMQDINKRLLQRRLMQNLEKFVGGREYGEDLRLLKGTI
ncbi:hypothetical protein Tco_0369441, partial [Tanacetum coccineum]